MASAGYDLTASDLKGTASSFAQQLVALLLRTQQWLQRLDDFGTAAIEAAYGDAGAAADLEAMTAAVKEILLFATTDSTAFTVIDNTTAQAAANVSVAAGAYGVFSSDPTIIALLKSVGTNKSLAIRKPSPLTNI